MRGRCCRPVVGFSMTGISLADVRFIGLNRCSQPPLLAISNQIQTVSPKILPPWFLARVTLRRAALELKENQALVFSFAFCANSTASGIYIAYTEGGLLCLEEVDRENLQRNDLVWV